MTSDGETTAAEDQLDPADVPARDGKPLRRITEAAESDAGEPQLPAAVQAAREAGETWGAIGMALGVTGREASRRFGSSQERASAELLDTISATVAKSLDVASLDLNRLVMGSMQLDQLLAGAARAALPTIDVRSIIMRAFEPQLQQMQSQMAAQVDELARQTIGVVDLSGFERVLGAGVHSPHVDFDRDLRGTLERSHWNELTAAVAAIPAPPAEPRDPVSVQITVNVHNYLQQENRPSKVAAVLVWVLLVYIESVLERAVFDRAELLRQFHAVLWAIRTWAG